ncbi:MAG: hypothetical protein HQL67_04745 [Magnetococcales bacterium]|nr:hypothetical protein [Magnetococcales bacterium]
MKQTNLTLFRFMTRGGFALLSGLLTMTPTLDVQAVGTWSYPQSEVERNQRQTNLEGQLAKHEKNYAEQFELYTSEQKKLAELDGRIEGAAKELAFKQKPLNEAIEKYRQAQALSLLDPMISTESQRLALVEVKQETAALVLEYEGKLQALENQRPAAQARVDSSWEQLQTILREIDGLMKHRDAVRELVFLQSVAD